MWTVIKQATSDNDNAFSKIETIAVVKREDTARAIAQIEAARDRASRLQDDDSFEVLSDREGNAWWVESAKTCVAHTRFVIQSAPSDVVS